MEGFRLKGASGSVAGTAFELRPPTVIGRAGDCDLRIDDEACAAHHCVIEQDGDGTLLLKHLASEAGRVTAVNGRATTGTMLAPGDEIRIGATRWVLQAPGLRPQRVLTGAAVKPRRSLVPWLLALALAAAAALAWRAGWLPF